MQNTITFDTEAYNRQYENLVELRDKHKQLLAVVEAEIEDFKRVKVLVEIEDEIKRRHNLPKGEALLEFFEKSKEGYSLKEIPLGQKQEILLNYLQAQPLLDFFMLYDENGADFVTKLVTDILNIKD